jgi:threonylcarbamoyladenosine tRNA methylthiotransferase MtaB
LVRNFGCRAAQADGAAIESQLASAGYASVRDNACADLIVMNSCTVTSTADDDVRQAIRRAHRENPEARILVTGCYAQRAPEELAGLPGVQWVVGNSHKTQIAGIIQSVTDYHSQVFVGPIGGEFLSAPVDDAAGDRTRPNLKIQDGCNNICTFCIIPSVRGQSRSASADQVVSEVQALAGRYREIVLSGINLGRWGRDAGASQKLRLVDLIRRLLDETPVERLRLSSVEPMDLSDDLMRLMTDSPRIARHVHAPLQSASDTVLKRMKRRYRVRHYASRIERAREWMPDAAIGADVMVGFPGETEADFEATRRFIEEMPFTYLHVFTYSERPGTPAEAMPGPVPIAERKRRNAALRELGAVKNREFRRRFIGRRLSCVTLENRSALSGNFLRIGLAVDREPNRIVEIEVGTLTPAGLAEAVPLPVLA